MMKQLLQLDDANDKLRWCLETELKTYIQIVQHSKRRMCKMWPKNVLSSGTTLRSNFFQVFPRNN